MEWLLFRTLETVEGEAPVISAIFFSDIGFLSLREKLVGAVDSTAFFMYLLYVYYADIAMLLWYIMDRHK